MSKQRLGTCAEGATTYALALASHHHRAQRIGHTRASRKDRQAHEHGRDTGCATQASCHFDEDLRMDKAR